MEIKIHKCLILLYCSIIVLVFYSVFLKGYFPVKRGLPGFAKTSDVPATPGTPNKDALSVPRRYFSRIIIMIIDAFREDFIFNLQNDAVLQNGSMPFLSSLIWKGKALPFLAKTFPPTVTLPRIKAITTGDIPGFVDVVLNFGSSHLQDDNLLTQFKMANMTQVFFGDDTWINLFPDHFLRFDGTSSFFVTDYTEVDNNVTRHLPLELSNPDWDVMILHYLGLDHIGHVSGPTSPLIVPKLVEMDSVIKLIYSAMERWTETRQEKSMLLICGDHGMSNQGGHGGASPEETIVPVILTSPSYASEPAVKKMKSPERILQTDIAPTLSILMGVPIPKNNLGQVLSNSLIGHTVEDKVRALHVNAYQVGQILQQNIPNYERDEGYQIYEQTEKQHAKWLDSMKINLSKTSWEMFGQKLIVDYQRSLRHMSSHISATSTTYDLYSMITAIAFLIMVFLSLCVLISAPETFVYRISQNEIAVFGICCFLGLIGHVTICTGPHKSELICQTDVLSVCLQLSMVAVFSAICVLLFSYTRCYRHTVKFKTLDIMKIFFLLGTLMHTVSLLSSSFVEEEHQTWYFYTVTIHVMVLIKVCYQQITNHSVSTDKLTEQITNRSVSTDKLTEQAGGQQSRKDQTESQSESEKIYLLKNEDVRTYILETSQNKPTNPEQEKYSVYSDCLNVEGAESPQRNFNVADSGNKPTHMVTSSSLAAILSVCFLLLLLRILRIWNQTEDKWRHLPDVGDWLVRPENKPILSGTVVLSMLCLVATRCLRKSPLLTTIFISAMICIYSFRAANGTVIFPGIYTGTSKGILEAQIAYVTVVFLMMEALVIWTFFSIRQKQDEPQSSVVLWDRVQTTWLALIVLLLRPHNVAVVAMLSLIDTLVSKYVVCHIKQPVFLALYCVWMGEAAFFFQGNSNSLTTVDVTAGYAGLVDYQPLLIGVLMFASTYAGPIFWMLSYFKYINITFINRDQSTYKSRLKSAYRTAAHVILLTQTLTLVVYTIIVTVERYHLFVWTVFSPKLLYEGTKTVVIVLFSWIFLLLSGWMS